MEHLQFLWLIISPLKDPRQICFSCSSIHFVHYSLLYSFASSYHIQAWLSNSRLRVFPWCLTMLNAMFFQICDCRWSLSRNRQYFVIPFAGEGTLRHWTPWPPTSCAFAVNFKFACQFRVRDIGWLTVWLSFYSTIWHQRKHVDNSFSFFETLVLLYGRKVFWNTGMRCLLSTPCCPTFWLSTSRSLTTDRLSSVDLR